MGIACDCSDDYDWFYEKPKDFTVFNKSRRKRCFSCNELINIGADCGEFESWRMPNSDIEERIYGEGGEVCQANFYMCEECTGLFFSMDDLGFCISLNKGERMRELAKLSGQDSRNWE